MFSRKLVLIIFGLLFPLGVQSKNNEEIVGLGEIAKLRAIARKAQLDHELALFRLRMHLPHHLLLATNPLESLNSSESISAKPISSESTLLHPLVSPQTSPKYLDFTLEPTLFQLKPTELTLLETSESIPFEINSSESSSELQSTSALVNSSIEATTNYVQYDESTNSTESQVSTSHNPNGSVIKLRNHPLTYIFDNSTKTLIMDQGKAKLEDSTMKASFNRNTFIDDENQFDNNTSLGYISSPIKPNLNISSLQKEKSRNSFHDAHSITKSRGENNNSVQNFSNLINIQKLPSHSIIIKPNSIQNNSAFIKPNETTKKFNRTEQFVPKIVNFESALQRPQNISIKENRLHEMYNSFGRNSFKNEILKVDENIHNFNGDVSTFNTAREEHFAPETGNFENLLLIESKFHEKGNSFLHGNFGNETSQLNTSQYHPEEKYKILKTENSYPHNNFENETPPMEQQNQKNQSFHPANEDLLQRRQYISQDRQNQELFLQYLNMIQSQNNQGAIRTAENDIDRKSLNQYVPNSPRITFYPIDWKTNEACESPVQQYELSPITYQISRESSEEEVEKPMAEKFYGLNEKMKNFQLGNYGDESGARAADPSDPRHFHSHSLEIHHTKHVRPSTYHSVNKHKEFSSKFQSTGHSTHFSFQKDHWNESPSILDQGDHGKHYRKDLPAFVHTQNYPPTNNFQSSTKSLDKHHWEGLPTFSHVANLHSSNNFHSSKSLDKQHQENLPTFGYSKDLLSPAHAFGHAENVPSLNDFHSPSKSLDEQHREGLSVFDHVENLPSPNNFHLSSKSLDKQGVHSTKLTPPFSRITINNQNNFISTDSAIGKQDIQIAQSNGDPIFHQPLRGDQPFDRSTLGSPYLFQIPRNADIRRFKRSLPLLKLFTDPNVQLDVPKTLENVGTIARNSFEDRRAPMYHVRNMMGSAKNTVLSTLKIPPQNALVPSRYKIVDKKSEFTEMGNNNVLGKVKGDDSILKQTNGNYLGNEIMETFHKVGNIVRESVKSGQETLQHMGDVFHNAKKAVSATKYSTPRLLLPYVRTPVLKRNKPDKIMLITPRFADVKHEDQLVGTTQTDDFVKVGDIMDAVGVSNPESKDTGISRLVLQPKKSKVSSRNPYFDRKLILSKRPTLQSRFGEDVSDHKHVENAKKTGYFILREDVERNEIDEISDTLANLKSMVGTKTLQDFLVYMKQKFLLEHLKDKLRHAEEDAESNENVGSGLALGNDLTKPFMGRPSKTELINYFRKNGDSIEDDDDPGVPRVNAINPQVYQNYFNETLKINEKMKELTEDVLPKISNLNDDKIGDCCDGVSENTMVDMKVPKKLKKPFIGKKVRKDSKYFYWN